MAFEREIEMIEKQETDPQSYKNISTLLRSGCLFKKFWKMMNDRRLCDAQIIVKGKHIDCHKMVLVASTEYFDKMDVFYSSEKINSV